MKWLAPPNFGSMNFMGHKVEADAHGVLDIAALEHKLLEALAAVLPSHGFTKIVDPEPAEAGAMPSTIYLAPEPAAPKPVEAPVPTPPGATPDEDYIEPEEEPGFDPTAPTVEDIDKLNRAELFAFIKAHGGLAKPPIKNEELREIARALIAPAP